MKKQDDIGEITRKFFGLISSRGKEICKPENSSSYVCFSDEGAEDPKANPLDYDDVIQCGGCLFYKAMCLNPQSKHFGHIEDEHACCAKYVPDSQGWDSDERLVRIRDYVNGELKIKSLTVHISQLKRVSGISYRERRLSTV